MAVIDIDERMEMLLARRYTCCKLGIKLMAAGMVVNKLFEILSDWRDDNGLNADEGSSVRRLEPKLIVVAVVERKHGIIVRPMTSQRNEDEELKQDEDAAVLQL